MPFGELVRNTDNVEAELSERLRETKCSKSDETDGEWLGIWRWE
jgi:hypothetical protein